VNDLERLRAKLDQVLSLLGQPGSNGGVHRGPDLKPRNVIQAVIMKAFIDDGVVVTGDGTDKKAGWRRKKKVRHAMVHNAARAVQRIFEDAAAGPSCTASPGPRRRR
jgi:hypothetical protein